MKTHIILVLFALAAASACSSKRDIASVPDDQQDADTQHSQMIEGQSSRLR